MLESSRYHGPGAASGRVALLFRGNLAGWGGCFGVRFAREFLGHAKISTTETYVALRVFVDNWRWYGVPFFLRTGKRLAKRSSEISIRLKEIPPILFNANPARRLEPNILAIRIQPDEGFSLGISCKRPGPTCRL